MRLINAQNLELESFTDPVPSDVPYAILSHTWGEGEVSFQDMQCLSTAKLKDGFAKIEATCMMAINHGLKYAWVDTCCIDKTSSAELSEAINSMFRWYKDATLCFALLSDFSEGGQSEGSFDNLRDCRWFTRGWCLQELIAPANLLFFDKDWILIGDKSDLKAEIEDITGVDRWVLIGETPLWTIPLAKRMCWAAKRQTSRVEDMAYSLLGIFDVNMPMIYGEGSKAFLRLQEEILKKTTDLSLLAWQAEVPGTIRGVLAESPAEFKTCEEIVSSEDQFRFRDEITMTNKGLKIHTALQYSGANTYLLDLHCYRVEANGVETRVGIYLKRALDAHFRHRPHETAQPQPSPGRIPRSIYMESTMKLSTVHSMMAEDERQRIYVEFPNDTARFRTSDIRAVPETFWHDDVGYFSTLGLTRFRGFVRFCVTSRVRPPYANHGKTSEESTQFILVFDMKGPSSIGMSLYAETGLQNSPMPNGFLDPFRNIELYGPLGDPFSLSVLVPGHQQDWSVSMVHRDHRHNYIVSADLRGSIVHPPCNVAIEIEEPDEPGAGLPPGLRPRMDEDDRVLLDPRNTPNLPVRPRGPPSAAPLQRHPYYQ